MEKRFWQVLEKIAQVLELIRCLVSIVQAWRG